MTFLIRLSLGLVALLLFLLAALFVPLPAKADPLQKKCLAEAMYFEARDQGWRGMMAVGVVIKNRVADPRYPDNICSVVRQGKYWRGNPVKHKCQFSAIIATGSTSGPPKRRHGTRPPTLQAF
jgi:spore germination cell wall hydrolase CwlJ-like protein